MDSLVVTGKFLGASKTEEVGQNAFLVRRFWLDMTTNPEYPNTPEFQLKGAKVTLVDDLVRDQNIQVKFNIDGRRYRNQSTNKEGVITNLNVWKIDVIQVQPAAAVQPRQPAAAPASGPHPIGNAPTPMAQGFPFANNGGDDDLPF